MREKTKVELAKLAEILISKYQIDKIKGTNEFLECALIEARRGLIELDNQSIKRYEKDLQDKCVALQGHVDWMCNESLMRTERKEKELFELEEELDDEFYNYIGDVVDDMAIIQRAIDIMSRFHKDGTSSEFFDTFGSVKPQVYNIPDYSMFVEGEDGLMVIKGSYKGKTLDQIDEVNFKGAKRGWAKWCLDNDKNLTEDDRGIFSKILVNQM